MISVSKNRFNLRWFACVYLVFLAGLALPDRAHAEVFRDVLEMAASDVAVTDNGEFHVVQIPGGRVVGSPGQPGLPCYTVRYRVPTGRQVKSFRIIDAQWTSLGSGFLPIPIQTPARSDERIDFQPPDGDGYRGASWYPGEAFEYAGGGYLRGRRVEGFIVRPVRYRGEDGELEYLSHLEVEVELEDSGGGYLKVNRAVRSVEESIDGMLDGMVRKDIGVGYEEWMKDKGVVLEESPSIDGGFVPSLLPDVDGSAVQYVIVTNEEMAGQFEELAQWKTAKGVRAVVKTVEWIEANYPNGSDLAETIRFFLQDAYANWGTEWVLLGGDTDVVPIRYVKNTYNNPSSEVPTDLYYSCLDGDWNDDGDEFFGEGYKPEAPGDSVDLYPDVFVGRIPVNTTDEASVLVDKLIQFVQAPSIAHAARGLFMAEVLFPYDWTGGPPNFDGCTVAESAIKYVPSTVDVVKLYENLDNAQCPGGLLETREVVIDSLNSGYGLAHHVGHGYVNVMSVGNGQLLNSDAMSLSNSDMPFFIVALNCDGGAVDYNCIAENLLFNPSGGAVGYLGSAREDYPYTSESYQDEWYNLVFHQGVPNVGKAFALSRVPFIPFASVDNDDRWTQMVHILLGDPELSIWTSQPKSFSVNHDSQMTLGGSTFDVTVNFDGSPAESAYVTLDKPGEAYAMGYTDEFGAASLPFTPDSTGSFTVTVTKHDFVPYLGSAQVVSAGGAHLHVSGMTVDDDDNGSSAGNDDGHIDRGETIELKLPLKNQGMASAYSVQGIISTSDPMVTIIDNSSYHGTIGPGSTVAGTGYLLEISPDAPDRHLVTLEMSISSSGGSWQDEAIIELRAPDVELYLSTKDDLTGGGNGDGIVDPYETIYLYLTLRDNGTGSARGLNAVLRAQDLDVSVTDSTSSYGDLTPGLPDAGDAFVFANGASSNPVFTLLVRDDYGTLDSLEVDMAPPDTIDSISGAAGTSSILLKWSPNEDADLRGYNVYRSDSESGPFVRVNEHTVESSSRYEDGGLSALTVFFYRVAAQDTSGNVGEPSPVIGISTSPALLDGWPMPVGVESPSSPVAADIDRDGEPELCVGAEEIYVLHHDGTELIDGDGDVRTNGVFSNTGLTVNHGFWSCPVVADIDNDGEMEIIANHMDGEKTYVWESDGSVAPGWPKSIGASPWGSPAVGDIDGDFELEIMTASGTNKFYAWNPDGTEVIDGDSNPSTDGVFAVLGASYNYGSPAVADLDGDGVKEIIFGSRDKYLYVWKGDGSSFSPAFPKYTNAAIVSAPAVADVDNDGELEIIVAAGDQNTGSSSRKVHVYNLDGTELSGWPKVATFSKDTSSSPAIGDVDGNGGLDVVVADANGWIYAWEGSTGVSLPGWPVQTEAGVKGTTGYTIRCGPTLADIDGDGFVEILVGDEGGRIHGYNHDGSLLAGFPIRTNGYIRGSIGAWDLDGDGLFEFFAMSQDTNIYVWKYSGAFSTDPNRVPWPFFKHDARRTSYFGSAPLVAVQTPILNVSYDAAGVELSWSLMQDLPGLKGWNVYRAEGDKLYAGHDLRSVPEGFMKLNADMLERGSTGSMSYLDSSIQPGVSYTYLVEQVSVDGTDILGPESVAIGAAGVKVAFLGQNFPNPFGLSTVIPYYVAFPGANARLAIFDAQGRLVRKLFDEWKKPGTADVRWDGRDSSGRPVPSGLYFYQLTVGSRSWSKKMTMAR
jgi:hypothetical protein